MFTGFHRHKNLENAIISLNEEVSQLKLFYASLKGKVAVETRERKKHLPYDAELRALEDQLDGKVVAVQDEKGNIIPKDDCDGAPY